MEAYALGILRLIKFLLEFIDLNEMHAKEVIFRDDFSVAGNLNSIKDYWDILTAVGPKYGYFSKLYEILSDSERKKIMKAQNLFANSRVKEKHTSVQLSGV